jgi:3-methyladenine DNA glycosylase AlkD
MNFPERPNTDSKRRPVRSGRGQSEPASRSKVTTLVEEIETELSAHGTAERAEHDKAYLKSNLGHYGTSVPIIRSTAKAAAASHPQLDHDDLLLLVNRLWLTRVHDCRTAAIELLDICKGRLRAADIASLERLLRDSNTWALVDPLAASIVGPLAEQYPEVCVALDRWANDPNFWMRRAALLALLRPLRAGDGDFERFSRYADAMLADKEFFIRKAIGWVLRETGKKRPDLVYEWLRPRIALASGVTIREAIKPLSAQQCSALLSAR